MLRKWFNILLAKNRLRYNRALQSPSNKTCVSKMYFYSLFTAKENRKAARLMRQHSRSRMHCYAALFWTRARRVGEKLLESQVEELKVWTKLCDLGSHSCSDHHENFLEKHTLSINFWRRSNIPPCTTMAMKAAANDALTIKQLLTT